MEGQCTHRAGEIKKVADANREFGNQSSRTYRTGISLVANDTLSHATDDLNTTFSETNNAFSLGNTNPFKGRVTILPRAAALSSLPRAVSKRELRLAPMMSAGSESLL